VAEVKDWGDDGYAVICVGKVSPSASVSTPAATEKTEAAKQRKRDPKDKDLAAKRDPNEKDLAAHLLQRAKDSISPRAIRRRRRNRNYLP
jgi:hypothetical protein